MPDEFGRKGKGRNEMVATRQQSQRMKDKIRLANLAVMKQT